jgi:3-hydroxybutyrate dehydrogenase
MLTHSSIKKLIDPADVGALALWLCSDSASMITGASYTIDGGWSAT